MCEMNFLLYSVYNRKDGNVLFNDGMNTLFTVI